MQPFYRPCIHPEYSIGWGNEIWSALKGVLAHGTVRCSQATTHRGDKATRRRGAISLVRCPQATTHRGDEAPYRWYGVHRQHIEATRQRGNEATRQRGDAPYPFHRKQRDGRYNLFNNEATTNRTLFKNEAMTYRTLFNKAIYRWYAAHVNNEVTCRWYRWHDTLFNKATYCCS